MFTRNYYVALAERFAFTVTSSDTYNRSCTPLHIGNGTTRYVFAEGTNKLSIYSNGNTNQYIRADYAPYDYAPILNTGMYMNQAKFLNPFQTVSTTSVPSNLFYYGGVFFGTGTTPATVDDYAFSGEFITNCTYTSSYNNEVLGDGTKAKMTVLFTITNNNDADITIGEVGYLTPITYRKDYSVAQHTYILLEHTTLDSPITIAPGGVGQVTYVLQMNSPLT